MQPYPNPNYYAQYMQPNPYLQRIDQLQQFQQTMNGNQFQTLGKMVENVEMVKATDIPMDGNIYYFPKADGTELYSKQWLPTGQTRILTFKPLLDGEPNNSTIEDEKSNLGALERVTEVLQEEIGKLNFRLDEILDKISKNPSVKSKKEVAEND